MWQILPHLYRLFYDDNIDLFVGELASVTTGDAAAVATRAVFKEGDGWLRVVQRPSP